MLNLTSLKANTPIALAAESRIELTQKEREAIITKAKVFVKKNQKYLSLFDIQDSELIQIGINTVIKVRSRKSTSDPKYLSYLGNALNNEFSQFLYQRVAEFHGLPPSTVKELLPKINILLDDSISIEEKMRRSGIRSPVSFTRLDRAASLLRPLLIVGNGSEACPSNGLRERAISLHAQSDPAPMQENIDFDRVRLIVAKAWATLTREEQDCLGLEFGVFGYPQIKGKARTDLLNIHKSKVSRSTNRAKRKFEQAIAGLHISDLRHAFQRLDFCPYSNDQIDCFRRPSDSWLKEKARVR